MTIPDIDVLVKQAPLTSTTPFAGAADITQHDKNAQLINVKDFGAIGDGNYYPISDWYTSTSPRYRGYANLIAVKADFPFVSSTGDSIDWAAIQAASLACKSTRATLHFAPGKYVINKTLFCYSAWQGAGTENAWAGDGLGTILLTYGNGNQRKWTDITGSDAATFTPLVVMGSSDTELRDMTLKTATSPWSAGVFVPSTRRNRFVNVDIRGPFAAGGLYIDATWSKDNSPVPATDIPYTPVQADDGANEISVMDCFLEGLWGLVVQGTTRNPDDYTAESWIWAPGGTSDLSVIGCRLACSGSIDVETRKLDGGGYKHNAAIKNTAKAGQGHNFVNCSFRTKSKYLVKLDRSNRDTFVNSYAETISSSDTGVAAEFAITSNTGDVSLVNDKINGPVTLNGTVIASSFKNIEWQKNVQVSTFRSTGELVTPNITANGTAATPVDFTSFDADGIFSFNAYDLVNGVRNPYLIVSNGVIRPTVASTTTIGTTGYPFSRIRVNDANVNGTITMGSTSASPTISTGTGSPEGVVTARVGSAYLRADGGAGNTFYVKETGAGNTGWVAK